MARLRVALFLVLSSMLVPTGDRALSQSSWHALTSSLIGAPVVGGRDLFWQQRDLRTGRPAIYGYDRQSGRTWLIKRLDTAVEAMAADATRLVWVERRAPQGTQVQSYILATQQEQTLLNPQFGREIGGLALANSVLYYASVSSGNRGIFAYDLATRAERQISATGRDPVASDRMVVWSDVRDEAAGRPTWSLHLLRLDGAYDSQIIARASAPFSAYRVAGDAVVWSALPPAADRRLYRYRLSSGTTTALSTDAARFPVVNEAGAAWLNEPRSADPPGTWTISVDRPNRTQPLSMLPGGAAPMLWAIWPDDMLVFSLTADARTGDQTLYVADWAALGTAMQPDGIGAAETTQRVPCGLPDSCGQVYLRGAYLYDAGGRWNVNGVQFFLPQFGINSWTFYDRNYWGAQADIDLWLDVARTQLNAQTLRIFVELPGNGSTPTSYATLYDFAQRANSRNMRLGLVVQNSRGFAMTTERRAWLDGLIAYFQNRNATALIAYVSAANEINNWCNRADCFDTDPAYVDAATAWVAAIVGIVRQRGSAILTTVGVSTEVRDVDGQAAAYDFMRRDSQGRTLAQLVDFLSPHNYAGGAYGVFNDLRYGRGYSGPIVLEEFGWSTDPVADDARFREGDPICRADPWNARCADTAPYFVEWSLRALRETDYAGGVAWMLADVADKRCGIDPGDLWTGLFASGGGYCGGTISTGAAQAKATATRVRLFYTPAQTRLVYLPLIRR